MLLPSKFLNSSSVLYRPFTCWPRLQAGSSHQAVPTRYRQCPHSNPVNTSRAPNAITVSAYNTLLTTLNPRDHFSGGNSLASPLSLTAAEQPRLCDLNPFPLVSNSFSSCLSRFRGKQGLCSALCITNQLLDHLMNKLGGVSWSVIHKLIRINIRSCAR